ncbi:MAG: hypothetical protein ACXQTM_08335 [Methanosarcinales archaeon]
MSSSEFKPEWEGKLIDLKFRRDKDGKNWISYLHGGTQADGKLVLLDKSQLGGKVEVVPGVEYTCLIHKELENVAFAKILERSFLHRLIIKPDGVCIVVLQEEKRHVDRFVLPDVRAAIQFFKDRKILRFEVILQEPSEVKW